MAVIIKIPTWATFNKFPVGTPPAGLAALNQALGGLSLAEGDANPVWADLQDLDLGGGPLVRGAGLTDLSSVTPIENSSFLQMAQVQLAVAVSGDVEGYEVYFELANVTDEIPASLPNRTYLSDPEDETSTVVHTWETWAAQSPRTDLVPIEIGGKWYVSNQNPYDLGQPLPASAWIFSGLTILTQAQFLAIRQANEQT